jgi:hypothetical protein
VLNLRALVRLDHSTAGVNNRRQSTAWAACMISRLPEAKPGRGAMTFLLYFGLRMNQLSGTVSLPLSLQ